MTKIKQDMAYELCEKLANEWLECADMRTLEEYFINAQMEYLEDLALNDPDKILEHCEDIGIDYKPFLETDNV